MRVSIPQLKLNDGEGFWGRIQHSADYFGFAEKDTNTFISPPLPPTGFRILLYELDLIIINTERRRPQSPKVSHHPIRSTNTADYPRPPKSPNPVSHHALCTPTRLRALRTPLPELTLARACRPFLSFSLGSSIIIIYHHHACPNYQRHANGKHFSTSNEWHNKRRQHCICRRIRQRQHSTLHCSQQVVEPQSGAHALQRQDTMLRLVSCSRPKHTNRSTTFANLSFSGLQPRAVQGMLDFDFICKRKTPSVAGIIYTFGGQFVSKM